MLLKEVLSPVNGLFSNMPDVIWGTDMDPTFIDVELFTRIGGLEASPLVEHYVDANGVLDTATLASLLFQRYGKNWQRIWDALLVEYNIMLTTMIDETRTTNRDSSDTETRDLTTASGGTVGRVGSDTLTNVRDGSISKSESGTNTRDGSISRSGDSTLTHNVTDLETRALTGSETESGTEKLKDTFAEKNKTDSTLTYSGSEKTVGTDEEDRDLTKRTTGTVSDTGGGTQTGNGSKTTDHGVYGVGGAGLANESRDSESETRNFADTKTNTRTDNLTETDSGTVDRNTSSTRSFTGRNDRTLTEEDHTGTVDHDTTFGKSTATTDGGTVSQKRTGTEGNEESSTETYNDLTDTRTGTGTETYNDLTDTRTGSNNETETRNLTDTESGTVGTVGNELVTDTFHSEGSSPLRTFQALIAEEIEGRSGQAWNFTDIIIRDVQDMIASKIWRQRRGAF